MMQAHLGCSHWLVSKPQLRRRLCAAICLCTVVLPAASCAPCAPPACLPARPHDALARVGTRAWRGPLCQAPQAQCLVLGAAVGLHAAV